MRLTALRTVVAIPCLALFGCVTSADPGSEEAVGTSEEEVVSTNRLSMNRLSMNRLSMNSLSMSRLTADGRTLATTDLLRDADGRELLRYTIACALPAGKSLAGEADGTTYKFEGRIGLAPDWLRAPLPEKSQRWITACLLAHVNGYGVEVAISLRGRNPALATDSAERRDYQQEEISFFGNVFQPLGKRDELGDIGSRMYACGGALLQLSCAGHETNFAPERTCASKDDCSLKFLGPCRDLADAKDSVCKNASLEGYEGCEAATSTPGGKSMKTRYDEVVTVFLQRPDFSAFYPLCTPLFP
ncbi:MULTISPECIES: hypothetical protein [Sorangium]|uniref:Secreted protein n=1 Tax=Sorangium cellulosum TaxID=56 RepID=A0A4P2R123_SORCE|nr:MULTISPECIES: hypothetical protein [Sorangium]AUX36644.1 uncharacterized protein SOCE836_088520 [Sorangium cellulosum]WCQ95942.1 hypothetical protein NQZ70_08719 [Sorangium sp. Soce836]